MSPKRVIWIAVIAGVLYIAFGYWVVTNPNFDLPPIKGAALAIVVAAAVCQIAAKWFFGLLFKESIQETGSDVSAFSAFKAALVGAGVARLIPAGGAITPPKSGRLLLSTRYLCTRAGKAGTPTPNWQ